MSSILRTLRRRRERRGMGFEAELRDATIRGRRKEAEVRKMEWDAVNYRALQGKGVRSRPVLHRRIG